MDKVKWLPDGDTIHTENGKKLRLLNIDTPEINANKDKPAEPFSVAAKERLEKLIGPPQTIYWQTDYQKKDRYGRILAHVFNQKGELLSAKLLEQGHARMLVIPPNDGYWQCLKAIENNAVKMKAGLWSVKANRAKSKNAILQKKGFQWVAGTITERYQSKKNLWFVLDDKLWVGLPNDRHSYFEKELLNKKVGDRLSLNGFVYQSHGKLRVKLKHPGMLMGDN
ncbi:thermonuclease family protein [Aliikangiella sp. G2MR2-5]|uniref:thermonuclease family protein n=1 Tax=Aliikangiella sp. G2MR2-5 TaxID=2788943 RepID=UPI0018ABC9E3